MSELPPAQILPTSVVCAFVPMCTRERFAQFSGLEEGVIRGMCDRGYLPTIKVGRYSMINLVALIQQCQIQPDEMTP